jgi:hypothetical protein
MRRRIVAFTMLVMGLAVVSTGTQASATPPQPEFNRPVCAVGGETVVSWKHVHVVSLDIDWKNSAGGVVAQGRNLQPKGMNFSTQTPPGVDVGGSVEVTVFFRDGAARLAPASCT